MNMATLAAAIRMAVVHPSRRRSGELACSPITLRSFVNSTTDTIKGGASTPLITAAAPHSDEHHVWTAGGRAVPNRHRRLGRLGGAASGCRGSSCEPLALSLSIPTKRRLPWIHSPASLCSAAPREYARVPTPPEF